MYPQTPRVGSTGRPVAVHAWGAVRRIQPRTESLETFAWLLLLIVALLCFPTG